VRHPVVALYAQSAHVPKKVRLLVEFLVKWFKRAHAFDLPVQVTPSGRQISNGRAKVTK
jgi:hypothetical protein